MTEQEITRTLAWIESMLRDSRCQVEWATTIGDFAGSSAVHIRSVTITVDDGADTGASQFTGGSRFTLYGEL